MQQDHYRDLWDTIRDHLDSLGVDLDHMVREAELGEVRAIVVPHTVSDRVRDVDRKPRDQVVMVRLDKQTVDTLDAWVETGAVSSRSSAAALFIDEGLRVRARELADLSEALEDVRRAKRRLRDAAEHVLGGDGGP